MKFREVAEAFNEIEQVSSRITITKLLADLFKKSTPSESAMIAYLSLGNLNPVYVGTKFNFAEKSMKKVVAKLLGLSEDTIARHRKKEGDYGLVVEGYEYNGIDKDLTVEKYLTVQEVAKRLKITTETVYNMLKSGRIEGRRIDKQIIRIPIESIMKLESNKY